MTLAEPAENAEKDKGIFVVKYENQKDKACLTLRHKASKKKRKTDCRL